MSTVISSGQRITLKSGKLLSGAIIKGGALIVSSGGKSSDTQIDTVLSFGSLAGQGN